MTDGTVTDEPGGPDAPVAPDLRVGVVGMGIGHLHLLCWLGVQGASAVAIVETDAERREGAAQAWGLPAVENLEELFALGVDVVDLCTPPSGHEEQVLRCLDAGVHVICEKPLVGSVAACDRLAVAAAEAEARTGARLMPIQQYRFGDGAARARALVDAGVTGRLFTASAATWWRRDRDHYDESPWRGTWGRALGGTVVNHAIHIHDLLTWIGGPIVELRAEMATRVNDTETEDCAVAIGRTADGGLVTLNATTGAATESSRLVWHFEHVTIESSTEAYDPAKGPWRFAFRSAEAEEQATTVWEGLRPAANLYSGQFQAFVDALPNGPLPVTLADAATTLELVTAFYTSARTGARLMPIQQYRFGDGAARARALVDAGITGRLFTASAATWWRRDREHYDESPWRGTWDRALGGTVVNHAIHIHDLLTWIGGPLVELRAEMATRVNDTETEDCAVATGRTADGGLVTLNATTGAATESSRLVWHFEHVTIESSTEAYDPAKGPWRFAFRSAEAERQATGVWEGMVPPPNLYSGQFQAFVDALPDGPLPVTLADAAATLELVTAFYTSARTGEPQTLPLAADHPARHGWGPPAT